MSRWLKITIAVTLSVLMLFSICSMALFYFLPIVERNITIGMSTDVNGDPYIDVEYWSNKEGNGVELLDIRLHGYATVEDFKKSDSVTYYKGIQIVGDSYGSIQFNESREKRPLNIFNDACWYSFNSQKPVYYYDSQNNISFKSINNLTDEYRFKISLGSEDDAELYFMKLLGKRDGWDLPIADPNYWIGNLHTGYVYDVMFLSQSLLGAARTNSEGLNAGGSLTIDVGTMFDFMKYDEKASNQEWISFKYADSEKLKSFIQEFAMVNCIVHRDGAKQSSDSMFGIIADSSDFEYTNPNIKDNYLLGKQAVNLTEKHFTLVDGKLDFTTKTKTFLKQNQYVNMIIEVDADVLKAQGITYTGFADNVKSYKDRIISFVVKNTQNGQMIYSEVIL